MVDPKIVEQIRSNLNKGYSKDRIKQALLKSGYSEEFIKEHFDYMKIPSGKSKKPLNKKIIGLFVILIILAAGVYYFGIDFFAKPQTPSEPLPEGVPTQPLSEDEGFVSIALPPTLSSSEPFAENKVLCIALAEDDATVCEILEEDAAEAACKEEFCVYSMVAGTQASCDVNDPDLKFWAGVLSSKTKDESACNQLEDPDEVLNCKAIVSDDITKCSSAANKEGVMDCEYSYKHIKGIQTKDQKVCEGLSDKDPFFLEFRTFCLAIITKDRTACKPYFGKA